MMHLFGFPTVGLSKIAVIGKSFTSSASVKLPLVGRMQHLSQQACVTGIPKSNVPSDILPGCKTSSICGDDPLPSSAKVDAS
jgi:hypothetical protein